MAAQIESIYKSILRDPRVRAATDAIARHFPSAPFLAIVVGTGATSGPVSFILIPLLQLIPGVAAAGSLAELVKAAISGKPIAPGSIFTLLQSVLAAGLGVPSIVLGTAINGVVKAVKVVDREVKLKSNEREKLSEQKVATEQGEGEGGNTKTDAGGTDRATTTGAKVFESGSVVGGDEQAGKVCTPIQDRVPSIKENETLELFETDSEAPGTTWTATKTFVLEKYHGVKPKL
ncbi:hypothetical protein FRC07_012225 [Ceratobasidium sp. 392]|nr:hypothetical protein FRC07_012225 [Ceratobasidium sp. 392]